MIVLFVSNDIADVWSCEENITLRRIYCIVGTFFEGLSAYQNPFPYCLLPNQLSSEEVALTLRQGWARTADHNLYKSSKLKELNAEKKYPPVDFHKSNKKIGKLNIIKFDQFVLRKKNRASNFSFFYGGIHNDEKRKVLKFASFVNLSHE